MPQVTFSLSAPIKLGDPPKPGEEDKRRDYSLSDMVRHFGHNAREYTRDMEGARRYQRTQAAVDSPGAKGVVAMLDDDLRVLAAIAEEPGASGWANARVPVTVKAANGELHTTLSRVRLPAISFLSLVEPIAAAAAALPASPTK